MKTVHAFLIAFAVATIGCSRAAVDDGIAATSGTKSTAAQATLSKSVPKGWIEDFAAAKTQAEKENKKILVAFSGSDWCPWCVKREKDVYAQPDFIAQASKNFVLVMIDSPQDSSILSPLARRQNAPLARQYGVRGYPTTLVLDAKGTVLSRFSGYRAGGPAAMLKLLAEK